MHERPQPASSIQPMTPPALDRVISTCLAKDPDERWQTAHDVKLQLEWIAEGGSVVGLPAPVAARRKSRERLAWAVAALAAVAAVALGVGFAMRAPAEPRQFRFEIAAREGMALVDSPRISPDGRLIAFRATDASGKTAIWLRSLDSLKRGPWQGPTTPRRDAPSGRRTAATSPSSPAASSRRSRSREGPRRRSVTHPPAPTGAGAPPARSSMTAAAATRSARSPQAVGPRGM
jgi:hypothetical protein